MVVFFVLDCFLLVLEVVVVLMLIVYVFEVLKKICIINKYVEFVGGNGGVWYVMYRGEEFWVIFIVMVIFFVVYIYYLEYIGFLFILYMILWLFIWYVYVKGKNSNIVWEDDI